MSTGYKKGVPSDPSYSASLARLAPAMDQLHALTSMSFDTLLLAEGPPQPDYKLLGICDDGLYAQKKHDECWALHRADRSRDTRSFADQADEWHRKALSAVRAASKIQATTAPGLYAKAMLARHTKWSAVLCQSLAEDFIACKGLRESLWPAGEVDA